MTIFPLRGAHAGDLIMALPAIGAALAWGPVTVAGLAPRYYLPFRQLPINFLFAPPAGHRLRPRRVRGKHHTDMWLDALPVKAAPVRMPLPLYGIAEAEALMPGEGWVLLSPWSDAPVKQWQVAGWCAVADRALSLGYKVAVAGPPPSGKMCAAIARDTGLNLVGKDTPDTWPALLARAALVVTTDSASCHVADALDIPVIGLYGPTTTDEFGPYWNRTRCVSADSMANIDPLAVCAAMDRWHARIDEPRLARCA